MKMYVKIKYIQFFFVNMYLSYMYVVNELHYLHLNCIFFLQKSFIRLLVLYLRVEVKLMMSLYSYFPMSLCPYVPMFICPYVPISLSPYVLMCLCLYVSMSLCLYVSMSLCLYVTMSLYP